MYVMKLLGLVQGIPTEHDGQYLVEYDPERKVDNIIRAHLVTTEDPTEAKRFEDARTAHDLWRTSRGTRHDGQPDRPLTAFSVELSTVEFALREGSNA